MNFCISVSYTILGLIEPEQLPTLRSTLPKKARIGFEPILVADNICFVNIALVLAGSQKKATPVLRALGHRRHLSDLS